MGPIKCLDTVPGALSLESLMSFTLNRPHFLSGSGRLRRDALDAGPVASYARASWLRFMSLRGKVWAPSVSAPRDVRMRWDGKGEVTEANVLATRETADTRQAKFSRGLAE